MKQEDFDKLEVGDVVKGVFSGVDYVITDKWVDSKVRITFRAERSVTMTLANDWKLVHRKT